MGESDALFWCATRDGFVVAGDAAQFRGAHRQLSTTCQTAAPAKRASPGHITHALYTQPSVKRRTLLLLCFLCPPLACAIHDVSSELQSVRVSVLCSMVARVSTHSSMVAGSMSCDSKYLKTGQRAAYFCEARAQPLWFIQRNVAPTAPPGRLATCTLDCAPVTCHPARRRVQII